MVTIEHRGYRFEVEPLTLDFKPVDGPVPRGAQLIVHTEMADGEWDRLRSDRPDMSEEQCKKLFHSMCRGLRKEIDRQRIPLVEYYDDPDNPYEHPLAALAAELGMTPTTVVVPDAKAAQPQ